LDSQPHFTIRCYSVSSKRKKVPLVPKYVNTRDVGGGAQPHTTPRNGCSEVVPLGRVLPRRGECLNAWNSRGGAQSCMASCQGDAEVILVQRSPLPLRVRGARTAFSAIFDLNRRKTGIHVATIEVLRRCGVCLAREALHLTYEIGHRKIAWSQQRREY